MPPLGLIRWLVAIGAMSAVGAAFADGHYTLAAVGTVFILGAVILGHRAWRARQAAVVRVLEQNPACAFYEQLGATLVREAQLAIGGALYPERWYGWRNLRDLAP